MPKFRFLLCWVVFSLTASAPVTALTAPVCPLDDKECWAETLGQLNNFVAEVIQDSVAFTIGTKILASRIFVGPHDFPPEAYAAYGIVAFPSLAIPETRERFKLACQAYVASLPLPSELTVDIKQQMVTVWPVDDPKPLVLIPKLGDKDTCEYAVEHYHLATALTALKQARVATGRDLDGRGPYLLAWSPADQKGKQDALVLILDLSELSTAQHFLTEFEAWREKIEDDPSLWKGGFSLERTRLAIKYWVDRVGKKILTLGSG
jgi:hypothetical protein